MGKHRGYRRLLRRGGLVAAVVVLGVGVWQGVAGATATSGVTTKIQQHNANCGHSIGTPFIGTAKFSRDGNTINVKINLTNGTPDTEFEVTLWMIRPDGSCKEVDFLGFLLTDELGQGKSGFSSDPVDPKQHKFFVDVASGIQEAPASDGPTGGHNRDDNDSLIVKLA